MRVMSFLLSHASDANRLAQGVANYLFPKAVELQELTDMHWNVDMATRQLQINRFFELAYTSGLVEAVLRFLAKRPMKEFMRAKEQRSLHKFFYPAQRGDFVRDDLLSDAAHVAGSTSYPLGSSDGALWHSGVS